MMQNARSIAFPVAMAPLPNDQDISGSNLDTLYFHNSLNNLSFYEIKYCN